MTQAKKRVAIFASGTGSNFQALADDDRLKEVMTISKLVCDKPGAPVVAKAQSRGVYSFVFWQQGRMQVNHGPLVML